MGGGRKSSVATPTDTDSSSWGGSPLLLSAFLDDRHRGALDPKDGVSTKARAVLQRGTCVNTRGIPLFYNRLHYLTKTAAQSAAKPLVYDRDHIPPTAKQWIEREGEVMSQITAALAAATAASAAAPTTLSVTVNVSSDSTVTSTTMPQPVTITVDIPWATELSTAESNNGLIAYDFLEETTSEICDYFTAGITAETLRSEYQGDGLETILKLHAKRDSYAVEHGDAFEAVYDEIVQEGIADLTNESYLAHASKLEGANRAMPPDRRRNPSKMAIVLENAVMTLGGEARNEARINIRTTSSHGKYAETHEQLQLAMGKVESDSLKDYLAGRGGDRPRALIGRKDPRRTPGGQPSDKPPWEVRGWDSSKGDKPCPGCGDGKHWWASCPTFPKPKKNPSLASAKKTVKVKKAQAASDAEGEEAPRDIKVKMAHLEQSEFTPIKDILAGYVDDDSTRSMIARLDITDKPPPDAPPSPPDLNNDSSSEDDMMTSDEDEDNMHATTYDTPVTHPVSPDEPRGDEIEDENMRAEHLHSLCAFPGCTRLAYLSPDLVMHACCGRTHAVALAVLNAQDQTAVGAVVPEVVIAEAVPQSSTDTGASGGTSYPLQPGSHPAGYSELGDGHDTDDEGDELNVELSQRSAPLMHIRIPPKCYIYVITTTGRQDWMLPGVYVGTQFGENGLSECHVGLRPPIAHQPACMKARDMGHALLLCREHLVPAIYRGVPRLFGLAVGAPIPGATMADINPQPLPMEYAPIAIRIAPSAIPDITPDDLLPSPDLLKRAILTLLYCGVGGDVPEVRGVPDASSLRRAEKILTRHKVSTENLNTATLKGTAWLLFFASCNSPVNGELRAAAFATIRHTLFECCANHLNIPLENVTKTMFKSLVPRLTTAYVTAVSDALDLKERMSIDEAAAADFLVNIPPPLRHDQLATVNDLQFWAPLKTGPNPSSYPSAPPSPPGVLSALKEGTSRAKQLTASICYFGVPLLTLCIFAAAMVKVTSVDAHQILDNGTGSNPPPQPLTGGATAPPSHVPWLLYFILGTGYANVLYLILSTLSSPNAQAEAVVGSRGTRSIPPPRAKSSPSRYQSQYINSIDRLCSGPSWLTLAYLIELIIAWYFHRGSRVLNIQSQPRESTFEKIDQRGIYWNAPLVRRPRIDGGSPAPTDARLACILHQLGSTLLLWREAGLPPVDYGIRWPPDWSTAIKTTANKLLLHVSCGQLLLYLVRVPVNLPLPGKLLNASESATARSRPRATTPARCLAARQPAKWSTATSKGKHGPRKRMIVDSGCTFHLHNDASDLINTRTCEDTISGLSDSTVSCTVMGDMPVAVKTDDGQTHYLLIPNVRVADQPDSLLSVQQLWDDLRIDCAFRDINALLVSGHDNYGHSINARIPFNRYEGLSQLQAEMRVTPSKLLNSDLFIWCGWKQPNDPQPAKRRSAAQVLKSMIHRGGGISSHIHRLPADQAASAMHRRLHAGVKRTRNLAHLTADAPSSLSSAPDASCPYCTEANAPHLPHPGKRYTPSQPGQLIHADIAGPFKDSSRGKRWAFILVDDHSRFKFVYPIRRKSDVASVMRKFVADFNKKVGQTPDAPVRRIINYHSDNAGEFVSSKFREMLNEHVISQQTSPPYISDLNGVAERAIRSIMEGVRADLVASNAPMGFWDNAMQHTVDILNRTTTPPDSSVSCYEAFTGVKPKIMHIRPFGCAAWAGKSDAFIRKTNMDSKAWEGINLGCSTISPGGYDIWVPKLQRVVNTSDTHFAECLFPWRPKGDNIIGDIPGYRPCPSETATDQPPGVPSAGPAAQPVPTVPPPRESDTAKQALASVVGTPGAYAAAAAKDVLVLFSGDYKRPDGLGAFLTLCGLNATLVDNDAKRGGDTTHDLMNDRFFHELLTRVKSGRYFAIFAAPPCSTFSVARHFASPKGRDGGPPPVRKRAHPNGLPDLPPTQARELKRANEITVRTLALLAAAHENGVEFIVENPADRGDHSEPNLYLHADHGSLWVFPLMLSFIKRTNARTCTFAQCMFGAPFQKYTTLMYSAGLAPLLDPLDKWRCTHSTHAKQVGGEKDEHGEWLSARAAAYPPDFNMFIARGLRDARFGNELDSKFDHTPNRNLEIPDGQIEHAEDWMGEANDDAERLFNTLPLAHAPSTGGANRILPNTPTQPANDSTRRDSLSPSTPVSVPPAPDTDSSKPSTGTEHANRRLPKTDSGRADDPSSRTFSQGPSSRLRSSHKAYLVFGKDSTNIKDAHQSGNLLFRALLAGASGDPSNHNEAMRMNEKGWRPAELAEIQNHLTNKSWTEIDASEVPAGRRLVRMTWAYKTKRSGKLKARLCIQGCSQVPGVDYDQTFCATLRAGTLRVLCAASANWGLHMRRWDFVAAYLQGNLEDGEVIYCSLPPGYTTFTDSNGNEIPNVGKDGKPRVYRVEKPIYGAAQSGRRWQRTLFPWLLDYGFHQHDDDSCVFSIYDTVDTPSGPRQEKLIIGCYVDDLFCAYSHDDKYSLYHKFTAALQESWDVEDEGDVHDLLNVEIHREGNVVSLKQTSYIERLFSELLPDGIPKRFQSVKTPCDDKLEALVVAAVIEVDMETVDPKLKERFQSIVGALNYCVSNTRPDVAYAVGQLCRVLARPTPELLACAERVLCYLYRTRQIGLCYVADQKPLAGMSDSNWATKHSTSGWVFRFCTAAVSWGSKKQKSVALSSCEAEIVASSEAAKEGVYLKRLLEGLDMHQGDAVAVSGDNQAAIALAYNPENHDKVKHVERRHFFVREKVEEGLLSVPYVRTVDNIADFFTKALPKETFFSMRDQIMNCDAHSSKEQRACVARGARFQMRAAHGAAIEASIGEQIYTGLFKSSYVGRGGVEPRVSLDPDPSADCRQLHGSRMSSGAAAESAANTSHVPC